jgi:hypothetical protein
MKRDIILWVVGFLIAASFMTFVAWCAGYNFDYRHPHIGFGVFTGTIFSAGIGLLFVTILSYYHDN